MSIKYELNGIYHFIAMHA